MENFNLYVCKFSRGKQLNAKLYPASSLTLYALHSTVGMEGKGVQEMMIYR